MTRSTVPSWSLVLLSCVLSASGNLVKRDPISWSRGQCRSSMLAGMSLDNAPIECGTISVPLDYADNSKGSIGLQMVRRPASQQPSKGGIFVSLYTVGMMSSFGFGDRFVEKLGSDWDLIYWDARGSAGAEPVLYGLSEIESVEIWGQINQPGHYESHGNLTVDTDVDFYRNQSSIIDEGLQKLDEILRNRNGANLTYIGTTANVRDVVSMADTLYGSDKDINFYGLGYGSYMGMMLTQMFPNRIGKVILDGVVNPQAVSQYLPILGFDETLGDVDEVLQGYYNTCTLVGSSKCLIAGAYPTAASLKAGINQLLEGAYKNWNEGRGDSSYNGLISMIYTYLSTPYQWELLEASLMARANATLPFPEPLSKKRTDENTSTSSLESRSGSSSSSYPGMEPGLEKRQLQIQPQDGDPFTQYSWTSMYNQISNRYNWCSDTPDADPNVVTTERVFEEVIRVAQTVSPIAASIITSEHHCHRYTSRAVERYVGPWNVQPKNTVLVIGNQADPITSFRNAQFVTKLLGPKARLVQQEGYGHTSLALNSTCTTNTIKQYLQGTIPDDKGNDGPDVLCQVDQGPFGLSGNTPWNITTAQNGDKLTAWPTDPGLVNFPGVSPPPVAEVNNNQNCDTMTSVSRKRSAFEPWLRSIICMN